MEHVGQLNVLQLCFSKAAECEVCWFGCATEITWAGCSPRVVPLQDVFSDSDGSLSAGLLQQDIRGRHRQPRGLCCTHCTATRAARRWVVAPDVFELCSLLSSFARVHLPTCTLQGEQFELSPATPLVGQAAVLGDRRTFSVYDLMQQATFGAAHSLNLLIRWKSTEGEWEQPSQQGAASLNQHSKGKPEGLDVKLQSGLVFFSSQFYNPTVIR